MSSRGKRQENSPASALAEMRIKSTGIFIFVLSGFVNVLALTGAIYMLQIYDRALTSQSVPTLLALSVLAIGLYLCQGVLDIIRSQILVRVGAKFDKKLAPLTHKVTIDMPRYGFSIAEAKQRSRDVDIVRNFVAGQGTQALFDLPWMPLYVAFIYMLHPILGLLVIAGATVLATLALITEIVTRRRASAASQAELARMNMTDEHVGNAEMLRAMGLTSRAVERFSEVNDKHLDVQTKANDLAGSFGGLSKVLRMILQSAVLGLGAFLTIQGDLTAGAIIAASVAAARALAPVDLAISKWKELVSARKSYKRLHETLNAIDEEEDYVDLPPVKNSLRVEKITVAAPSTGAVLLADASLELEAGSALALIGPSGSGKTTFVRAITGIWPLVRGHIRLDEADIRQWRIEDLGKHIGYLPQDVSLLDGTVSENISRFDPNAQSDKIIAAAQGADVHEMIVRLPNGYQTELGPNGLALSAGQRQRIALARALYDNPFLVVLDEPNSNLDADGDQALNKAIESVKARKGIVVIIAHRPSAITSCDYVGVVNKGKLTAFGPKEEILQDQLALQRSKRNRPNAQPQRADNAPSVA